MSRAFGPETRMIPTPAWPGAVAMAAMVSVTPCMEFSASYKQPETERGSDEPRLSVKVVGPSGFPGRHLRLDLAGNVPLLGNGQNVVGQPVEYQACREPQEEDRENDRHQFH